MGAGLLGSVVWMAGWSWPASCSWRPPTAWRRRGGAGAAAPGEGFHRSRTEEPRRRAQGGPVRPAGRPRPAPARPGRRRAAQVHCRGGRGALGLPLHLAGDPGLQRPAGDVRRGHGLRVLLPGPGKLYPGLPHAGHRLRPRRAGLGEPGGLRRLRPLPAGLPHRGHALGPRPGGGAHRGLQLHRSGRPGGRVLPGGLHRLRALRGRLSRRGATGSRRTWRASTTTAGGSGRRARRPAPRIASSGTSITCCGGEEGMKTIQLVFGIHSHQSEGDHPEVFESQYQRVHKPFLSVLNGFPDFPAVLYYCGSAAGVDGGGPPGVPDAAGRDGAAKAGGAARRRVLRAHPDHGSHLRQARADGEDDHLPARPLRRAAAGLLAAPAGLGAEPGRGPAQQRDGFHLPRRPLLPARRGRRGARCTGPASPRTRERPS